jgi:integral membrane protein (TIGR01906 family)
VLETAAVALSFTALLLGVTLGIVAAPGVTSYLIRANRTWVYAGMSEKTTIALADKTRQWVTGDLYAKEADRRPAALSRYTTDELSHLDDVRAVMAWAQTATGVAAAILATWMVIGLILRRWGAIRRGVLWGGIVPVALVGVLAAAALTDFSATFAVFHSLFFTAGTWEFPADSLLIRVFPAGFWMSAGAVWGLLTVIGGIALVMASRTLPRDDAQAQRLSQRSTDRRAEREAIEASARR